MSDKRFKVCIDSNNGVGLFDNSVKLLFIKFNNKEDAVSCKDSLKYQCNLMNELYDENEQLKEEIRAYPINEQYAEEIIEQNQKLLIERNDLRRENEQLKSLVNACEYGQKSLMEEMKCNDEALDKIWEIMKELYGVIDDE